MFPEFFRATLPEDYTMARQLFREYATAIGIDFCFQNFEKELEEIAQQYGPPTGGLILCGFENEVAGCAGIRGIDNETAELKRMYIKPAWQGKGWGKQLLDASLQLAKHLHYSKIRLDTFPSMKAARALYLSAGFTEISPYYRNPNEEVIFMEKILG
jgi:putative acetyltransferase